LIRAASISLKIGGILRTYRQSCFKSAIDPLSKTLFIASSCNLDSAVETGFPPGKKNLGITSAWRCYCESLDCWYAYYDIDGHCVVYLESISSSFEFFVG